MILEVIENSYQILPLESLRTVFAIYAVCIVAATIVVSFERWIMLWDLCGGDWKLVEFYLALQFYKLLRKCR